MRTPMAFHKGRQLRHSACSGGGSPWEFVRESSFEWFSRCLKVAKLWIVWIFHEVFHFAKLGKDQGVLGAEKWSASNTSSTQQTLDSYGGRRKSRPGFVRL